MVSINSTSEEVRSVGGHFSFNGPVPFPLIQLPRKSEAGTFETEEWTSRTVSINSTSEEVRRYIFLTAVGTVSTVSINSTSEEVRS